MTHEDLLTTAGAVLKELGPNYSKFCGRYDGLKRERAKTTRLARHLFPGTRTCAICGERGQDLRIEVAHIQALEECGVTAPENVMLLCSRPGKLHHERGCHQLFDDGFASVSEIDAFRSAYPHVSQPAFRSQMQERYQEHYGSRFSSSLNAFEACLKSIDAEKTRGALRKAQNMAERYSASYAKTSNESLILRLKTVEMMRRRAARNSLDEAAHHFEELLQGTIPEAQSSSFFYEGGYIELLRGHHKKALQYFDESRNAVNPREGGWMWAAATCRVVHCKVTLARGRTPWNKLLGMIDEAERFSKESGGTDGMRWVMNCRLNRIRLLLAKGDVIRAVQAWESALGTWRSMTALTGWDRSSRTVIVGTSGLLSARAARLEADARIALKYLARASVGLLGAARQHPETVRDLLFTTADTLMLLGQKEKRLAAQFRETAERTRDGSSWLHPYSTA